MYREAKESLRCEVETGKGDPPSVEFLRGDRVGVEEEARLITVDSNHKRKQKELKFVGFLGGLFALSRASPAAYGGSQARGLIGASAAGLSHRSRQRGILNPLSKARGQTRNLSVPSQIR